MKMNLLKGLALAVIASGATMASAQTVVYTTNFETDQSANFQVRSTTSDFVANFNYDYSTYAATTPTDGPASIPAAPSGAGTRGLRLAANVDGTNSAEAVSAFVTAATAGSESRYVLKFDAFQQYPGPGGTSPVAGTGTTSFMTAGDAGTATVADLANNSMNGFIWGISHEGGSGTDVRYSEGNGTAATALNSTPNWLGTNAIDNAAWSAVFPGPTYNPPTTPGRAWTTWEMEVDGNTVTVYVTPTGGTRTQAGFWGVTAAGSVAGNPFVGFTDSPFTSSPNPSADNFVIIDNLSVTTLAAPAAAEAWEMYD